MDAVEYKHVVLGGILLKYISDAFEERCLILDSEKYQTGAAPEDNDNDLKRRKEAEFLV